MKRRKFADGGETIEMMPSAKPEGGRFDDKDIYARARRFVESNKEESKPASKPTRKAEAPKAEATKAVERASDTSKRFPSEMSAPKDNTAKSVSERIKESRERAEKLRKDVEENSSGSAKILRSLNALAGKKAAKAEEDALQHRLNIKESMAEDEDQNVVDQYPKGTTYDGRKSRNKAGYGKKVDLPMEGKAKGGTVKKYASGGMVSSASRRADGIATKGKTKCRIV